LRSGKAFGGLDDGVGGVGLLIVPVSSCGFLATVSTVGAMITTLSTEGEFPPLGGGAPATFEGPSTVTRCSSHVPYWHGFSSATSCILVRSRLGSNAPAAARKREVRYKTVAIRGYCFLRAVFGSKSGRMGARLELQADS